MSTPDAVWAEVAKTYNIHPETLAATGKKQKANHPAASTVPVEHVHENDLKFHIDVNGEDLPFDGETEDLNAGGVPATVYRPASQPVGNCTLMVYFHGGSLMMGSRVTHEPTLKALAEKSGVVIMSVEYRLLPCPENPMVPFEDAVTATRWAMKNRAQFCVGGAKIGIGGDSAGGQIVLGVMYEIKSGLDFMVLVYPTADFNTELPSCKEFERTPAFNTTAFRWRLSITNAPFPNAEKNPQLNAGARGDLSSFPPVVIVLAQLDPLRDSGKGLAERLKASGVLTRLYMIEGVPHGFFSLPGLYPNTTAQAIAYISDFLKKFQ